MRLKSRFCSDAIVFSEVSGRSVPKEFGNEIKALIHRAAHKTFKHVT